ncbi:MAG: DUF5791 family protein [Halobacteriales archaeon]
MSPAALHRVVDRPGERSAEELLDAHAAQLQAAIDAAGVEAAAEAAGLDQETVSAIADGDSGAAAEIPLEAAAELLARPAETASGQELLAEALDELLFGMTAGVLNVDVVAAELESDLDPREVQQALEGRYPVTLGQYVELQRLIASRSG